MSGDPSSSSPSSGPAPRGVRPPRPLIFSVTITGVMASTLVAPSLPDIVDDLGVAESQVGLVLAAATLPGVVVAPLIGLLADRYGRRRLLVPCLALFGAAGTLGAVAPSFGALVAVRLLQGVGSAGLVNLAVVTIGDHWSGTERARVIGQNSAVLTAALAVLPPLGGVLTDLAGWRSVFLLYAVGLVTAVVVHRRLPPDRGHDVALRRQISDAVAVLRVGRVAAAVMAGMVIFILVFGVFLTAVPLYVEDRFGLGAGARGLVLALPSAGSFTAAMFIGRLRQRLSVQALVVAGSSMFTVGFGIIAAAPVLGLLLVGAVLYGLAEGLSLPSLQDTVLDEAPDAARGAVVAAWVGAARAGQTIGPVIAGWAVARAGGGPVFVAGAVVGALLAVAQLVVGRPQRTARPAT